MAEKKVKVSFKDQIKMGTQEICETAIKNGWIAALISLGITLIFSSIGFFTQSDNETLNYFLDPWLMVDVILMAVLAFFIYKKSRTAATLMFIYFVISKFTQWYDLGNVQGLPMALLFMYFYFNAMRGTFIWHSKYKNQDAGFSLETEI
jgi:ABC-type proline/glycine betaine transport system permease subunit